MVLNGLKATKLVRGDSSLFTTKSPGNTVTHLIDLGRMKGWIDLATKIISIYLVMFPHTLRHRDVYVHHPSVNTWSNETFVRELRDHSFRTPEKFYETLIPLAPYVYQGVTSFSFSEKNCVRTKWMLP